MQMALDPLRAVRAGRYATDLKKRAIEAALRGVAALGRDIRHAHARFSNQRFGMIDTHGVDVLPEANAQLLRHQVRKM